jgi:hypothetical protein
MSEFEFVSAPFLAFLLLVAWAHGVAWLLNRLEAEREPRRRSGAVMPGKGGRYVPPPPRKSEGKEDRL